jgi:predicted RNA binding protein YcfA (HicA-like mRNA interferase family)
MKLPRNLNGDTLARALQKFDYQITRQTGSHLRLTTQRNGEHHVTIPNHSPLKPGTLNGILKSIANHFQLSREELLQKLFD